MKVCSFLTLPDTSDTIVHDHLTLISSGIEMEGDVVICSTAVDEVNFKPGSRNYSS
jgi:hypothetical protein